jgi:flavin reductase (DIM6/NTAB) family NADH-FMN oxidoreductase RutF
VDRCPLQLEATVTAIHPISPDDDLLAVEAEVVHVHAHRGVVIDGTNHIDTSRWRPLIYSFRHYFTLGTDLGHSFRAEA